MRKLILRMNCSLDGFVSGPNGENEWIFPDYDEDTSAWAADALWRAGAHLMGSATYREMAAHWPSSTEVFAPPMNKIPKVVFSKTLKEARWPETRIASGDLAEEIARLKAEPGGDLVAHGGVRFAQSLIQHGLVDEYRLFTHPVVLGKGKSPFSNLARPLRLKTVNRVVFGTGLVLLTMRNTESPEAPKGSPG